MAIFKKVYKTIFFIVVLGCSQQAYLQESKLFLDIDYNTFSHSKLKQFQEEFVQDLEPVRVKTVDNFPANVGFTLGYEFVSIKTAIYFSYNTTGGKISYGDYSGQIRILQPVTGYSIGGIYHIDLIKGSPSKLKLGLKSINTFSFFKIDNYSKSNNTTTSESFKFSSRDIGLGSFLLFEQPLSIFSLRIKAGYDYVFGGKLIFSENKEAYLENNRGSAVRTNWSGIRTGLGIAYIF